MARGFVSRFCCIRPSKTWITLLCRNDDGFSLLKTFPVVFCRVESDYEHESRCKAVFPLERLAKTLDYAITLKMSEGTAVL